MFIASALLTFLGLREFALGTAPGEHVAVKKRSIFKERVRGRFVIDRLCAFTRTSFAHVITFRKYGAARMTCKSASRQVSVAASIEYMYAHLE